VPSQEKPTVVVPALSASDLADVLDAPDVDAPTVAGGAIKSPAGDNDANPASGRAFSETAWFMVAVTPEALADAEGEAHSFSDSDLMTDRYRTEERLPEEVRKDFSLGTDVDHGTQPTPRPRRGRKRRKK